ncbi:MAG: nitric-oxide reductase large subunit, partial [Stenotrophobium sp.]
MRKAVESVESDEPELSPWWLRTVLIVMVLGFAILGTVTLLAYRNAPPIPEQVVGADGALLFTSKDIGDGQAVFLKYGLMDNGSIWGHGAYLGPDYSAEALHRLGEDAALAISGKQYGKPTGELDPQQRAAVQA